MSTDLEDVWRRETPHVLGALVRRYGNFDGSEDAVQEALLAAARQWPADGVPDNPRGWLIRVASRRLVDHLRSESARAAREEADGVARPADADVAPGSDAELDDGGRSAGEDTLKLLLLCCHPSLTPPSQVALTLRAVAGLTTAQVSAVFLVPESTMAQRISRAKSALREAGARFELPADQLPGRVAAVLRVLYLVFTEGHTATTGTDLVDVSLTAEALRLTRRLHALVPDDDEVTGALALMLLTGARTAARTDAAGDLVPLQDQDRSRWDAAAIAEGVRLVEGVLPDGPVGPFQLQAAIAAVHGEARTWEETDWLQITVLYRMLDRIGPGPAVTLNLGVAVGMAHGPEAGLAVVEPLLETTAMRRHHRAYAVRAHLLEMSGRIEEAAEDYARAAALTTSIPEQRYLNRRAQECSRRPRC